MPYADPLKKAYTNQKGMAKARGISFLLSFPEWYRVWSDSGHLHERGCFKGQYCMARFGDQGAYELGNVKIILTTDNSSERHRGENNHNAKINRQLATKIKNTHIAGSRGKNSTTQLARQYGVHPNTIRDIVKGRRWRA